MDQETKENIYYEVSQQILAVLDGETNITARMATTSCLLHYAFEHFFWTGFYCVDPQNSKELVVGPYQGSLGCLRIPFGKGVCGTAVQTGETQIVDDVHEFPGHIACDVNSESEIVIPVRSADNTLLGVLDIDSDQKSMFDNVDKKALEALITKLF